MKNKSQKAKADPRKDVDCRNIDVGNVDHQAFLRLMFDDMIEESTGAVDDLNMHLVWDRNMLYYEGHQTPVGFTNNYLFEFVRKNWDKLEPTNIMKKGEDGKVFVVNNRINRWVDGIEGEYTSPEKKITVIKDDDYQNDNIENAISKMYNKLETDKQMWSTIVVPEIRKTLRYGYCWDKTIHNKHRNVQYGGEIMANVIDCRNVLFDPTTEEEFFKDTTYRIHRKTMNFDQAVQYLAQYGIDEHDVQPEGIDRLKHLSPYRFEQTLYDRNRYVNLYYIEFKKTYYDTYSKSTDLAKMGADPETQESGAGLKEERDYYFYALYTQGNGCLKFDVNKNTFAKQDYDKFYLTPMINKKSDIRPFPLSHIEEGANIQDIINISESLILNSAMQRSKIRLFIKQQIYDKYGDKILNGQLKKGLLSSWLNEGGGFPIDENDLKTAVNPFEIPDLPKEVYEFLELAQQNFKTQTDTQSALQGDYPRYNMSGKAIEELGQQKRKKIGYFDININWTNTQRAKKIYNIFANEYNTEQIIKNIGAKPGTAKGIIINGLMSYPEYEQHLVDVGLVDDNAKMMLQQVTEEDKDYVAKRKMILEPAAKKYQEVNEVQFINPKPQVTVNQMGMLEMPDKMKMYTSGIVFINTLSVNDSVDIKVEIDFDKERDATEDRIIAMNLFEKGALPVEMLYDFLGGTWSEKKGEIMSKLSEASQIKMIAEEIDKRGEEFMGAVQKFIDNWDQLQAQKIATKKPKDVPEKDRQGVVV